MSSNIDLKKAEIDAIEAKLKTLQELLDYYLKITIDNLGIWYESSCVVSDINTEDEVDTINSIKSCDHLKSQIAINQKAYGSAKVELADYLVKSIGIPDFEVHSRSFIFRKNTVILEFYGLNGIPGDAVFQISTDRLLSMSNPYEIKKTLEEFLL